MMNKPLVSLCMPCYNCEQFIGEAIDGALVQTYEPLEIVIVDNCSTDGTSRIIREKIAKYKRNGGKHEIRFVTNETNIGGGKNIDRSFRLARGELLVPAHGDDVSLPNRVEKIVEAWESSGRRATVISHAFYSIGTNGEVFEIVGERGEWWQCSAIDAYHRVLFEEKGFHDCDLNVLIEDVVFRFRALMLGSYAKIDIPLMKYRQGSGVSSHAKQWRAMQGRLANGIRLACELVRDELAERADQLDRCRVEELSRRIEDKWQLYNNRKLLTIGKNLRERWIGYQNLRVPFRKVTSGGLLVYLVMQTLCLFPNKLTDYLIDRLQTLLMSVHRRRRKVEYAVA